jgi:hypothetical protein
VLPDADQDAVVILMQGSLFQPREESQCPKLTST